MKLKVEVYREDIEEAGRYFSNCFDLKLVGFVEGYIVKNNETYAIVYFEKIKSILQIPIERIIPEGY